MLVDDELGGAVDVEVGDHTPLHARSLALAERFQDISKSASQRLIDMHHFASRSRKRTPQFFFVQFNCAE